MAFNKEGKISHINEVACKLFRCPAEQATGMRAEEFFGPNPPVLDTLKTGRNYNLKERTTRHKGQAIHYLTSGFPLRIIMSKLSAQS